MTTMTMGSRIVELSGSVNYAGLWLDGGDVDVESFSFALPDQDLHYLQGRVRAAVPFALGGAATVLAPYAEVEAQASLGETADLAGVDLDFVADDVVTAKLGAALTHVSAGGVRVSAELEGRVGSEGHYGAGAGLSVSMPF